MKDLVCIVADKQIGATLDALLLRRHALGIRAVEAEILVHPHHDSGCCTRPADLLRGYRQAAEHALIVLDHAWVGVPVASGAELEVLIEERLGQAGMADWAVPVVIEPELEAWVFSASPHVPELLGWKGPWSAFRQALEDGNLWRAADVKPADPKAAIEYVLSRTGKSRFGVSLPQACAEGETRRVVRIAPSCGSRSCSRAGFRLSWRVAVGRLPRRTTTWKASHRLPE